MHLLFTGDNNVSFTIDSIGIIVSFCHGYVKILVACSSWAVREKRIIYSINTEISLKSEGAHSLHYSGS